MSIGIDTYNDSRRNYVFRVTALGLQEDGIKIEGQGSTDNTPDFVWYSAAQIDAEGWTMEAAIPFASLRVPRADTLNFGFDLVRWRGATGALESWAPRRRGNPCDLCQKGTLLGITGIDTRPTTDILPYVSASRAGVRRYGNDSVQVGGAWEAIQPPLALGRFSRVGLESYAARAELTQYPNNRIVQRTQQQLDIARSNTHGGGLVDWRVTPVLELQFRRSTSVKVGLSRELATLFGKPLRTTTLFGDYRVNAWRRILLGGSLQGGDREIVDPNNPRLGKGVLGRVNVTLRPVPQASLDARAQRAIDYETWGGTLVDDAKSLGCVPSTNSREA